MTPLTRLVLACIAVSSVACDPLGTCLEKAGPAHAGEDLLILNTKKSSCAHGEFVKEDPNAGFVRAKAAGFEVTGASKNKSIDDVVKDHDVLTMTRPAK